MAAASNHTTERKDSSVSPPTFPRDALKALSRNSSGQYLCGLATGQSQQAQKPRRANTITRGKAQMRTSREEERAPRSWRTLSPVVELAHCVRANSGAKAIKRKRRSLSELASERLRETSARVSRSPGARPRSIRIKSCVCVRLGERLSPTAGFRLCERCAERWASTGLLQQAD